MHKYDKKMIIMVSIVVCIIVIILIGFRSNNPLPCDYTNFAWGAVKKECDCLGVKIDTSCKTPNGEICPDAGSSTECIGIVKEYTCYNFTRWNEEHNAEWTQILCKI